MIKLDWIEIFYLFIITGVFYLLIIPNQNRLK